MAQYVAVVQARHGDLRNDHLKESGESRKDPKLVRIESKPCRGRKVSAFHDPRRNKYFRMSLVDDL